MGGKGTGVGNLNLRAREKRIRRGSCNLCADANNGRGCWVSACNNGPVRNGLRRQCDCHRVTAPHKGIALRARNFGRWSPPPPAL